MNCECLSLVKEDRPCEFCLNKMSNSYPIWEQFLLDIRQSTGEKLSEQKQFNLLKELLEEEE